ncbi:MAG TPA: type IV secretory system conjugative DNA transfer family protein [Acidimicrobiales bacterium]|nr:type IV secretory system conjugative DNA transfer family protein [Acidimicrobiales bacterium]
MYLGHDADEWHFVPPELSVMILGPPRSGKTSALIIPNVLAANGAVVSTSTKPDVLDATAASRSEFGRCHLFDPTGSVTPSGDVEALRWSPLQACGTWDGARATARSLVQVAASSGSGGMVRPESSHWNERAQSMLGPLLYAAALEGSDMRTVLTWVDRRKSLPAQIILAGTHGGIADLAANALEGLAATDERELSGIWSTASGALSGFRTERALAVTVDPTFDADRFAGSADTIYICAPAHRQALVAPMVVGLIEDVRNAAYRRAAIGAPGDRRPPPVLLALDEVANIAPLPNLPSMISEGGGQGVVTLASLQDLSQARQRWPDEADGFPSLFGATLVLPGIGDVRTLQALSTLAGDEEIATRTVSSGRAPSGHPVTDLVTGGRQHVGESATTQWRRRLPPDLITRGSSGLGLAFDERNQPTWIRLAPAHSTEPWKTLSQFGRSHRRQPPGLDTGRQR